MKKSILCILVLVMTVGCLAGCGREKSTRQISTAECDPAPEYVEKCYHENTDERGICLDCGEEAGVALATYNPVEIFDIESDGFGGAWNIRISPKEEYEGCRFENVSILLKGTKRASDGTLDNNQELMSIPLNERGIGQSSGFLGDVYGTPCWVIGQTAFGIMPHMHCAVR